MTAPQPHIITEAELQPFLAGRNPGLIGDRLAAFIEAQCAAWPLLAEARKGLDRVLQKQVALQDCAVTVQHNPGRIRSCATRVDKAWIAERPCFLCPDRLYPGQKGLPYLQDWLILNNPFPIFYDHLVVTHTRHIPQRIEAALDVMLEIVRDLGGAYTAFYNGPACGASAPDHLHFQLCPEGQLRLPDQLAAPGRRAALSALAEDASGSWYIGTADQRGFFFCTAPDPHVVRAQLTAAIRLLAKRLPDPEEPCINLIVAGSTNACRGVLLPRKAHRPACYYREDAAGLLVSPGAVDLGGVVILPRPEDYAKIDKALLLQIFSEVCRGAEVFEGLGSVLKRVLRNEC